MITSLQFFGVKGISTRWNMKLSNLNFQILAIKFLKIFFEKIVRQVRWLYNTQGWLYNTMLNHVIFRTCQWLSQKNFKIEVDEHFLIYSKIDFRIWFKGFSKISIRKFLSTPSTLVTIKKIFLSFRLHRAYYRGYYTFWW